MSTKNSFKTKTGYCHVLQDKIVLYRKGFIGDLAKLKSGEGIYGLLAFRGVLAVFLFYMAFSKINNNHWVLFGVYFGIAIFLVYNIITSLNLSAASVIDFSKIIAVEFKPAKKLLTRSYFIVNFKQNNGKTKSRLIMLPGSLNNGNVETKKALEIIKNAELIKNNIT
ncbi:MAG: phosphoribosylaminoimidazolesuccinocarboxamide synthase [Lacinutrix sp.]|uniref:phosphoribosylaminoimidazolesuccinocarboxamide synthase n=1 Tax=Lacinutrix sp. TaxID=1937692 RepID=UPI0030A81402